MKTQNLKSKRKVKPLIRFETVEEFLARGGKIKIIERGKRKFSFEDEKNNWNRTTIPR